MLERSIVSEQDIRNLLAEKYDIRDISKIISLKGGSANCYHIRTGKNDFVLKEFQSRYTVDDVKIEPEITEFLRAHGIPTAKFIQALKGEYVWQYRNRTFHLQEYVEGTIYHHLDNIPDWIVQECAACLGRIHKALTGFPLMKEGFHSSWFNWNIDAKEKQYSDLINRAK
jgi:Ser/Thr protein kinase RdoA (MazF antagonist)